MSLNITNIKIENVRKGNDNQVAKGIHGKFTLDLYLDDGTHFITLKDMSLRKTRNDTWYIQPPYSTWGEGNKNKSFYFFFYPNSDDRDAKLKDLVGKVVAMVDAAEGPSSGGTASASTAPSAPAASADNSMGGNLF